MISLLEPSRDNLPVLWSTVNGNVEKNKFDMEMNWKITLLSSIVSIVYGTNGM